MKGPWGAAPRHLWGALALLTAGLIGTALASLHIKADVEAGAQREFDFICSEIRLNIADRLASNAQILHGGAALFDASERVSREEWRAFTRSLQVERQLPGIQGIGFAQLVPREQPAAHIQAIRREGFPNYRVWPAGEREIYSAITYLEPFSDRNLRAFGYDMFSEAVRRAAMERARDENGAAMSGKVILVQETAQNVQAGTLMYVPVYRHGLPTATIEQRRAAIQGWVYSPYRMMDLMHGTLRGWDVKEKDRQVSLQVYDGDVVSASTLLYDSHSDADEAPDATARVTRLIPIEAAGHRWTLRFIRLGGPDSYAGYGNFWLVLLGGTVINLLCFGLALSLLSTRANARRTRTLVESLPQMVWTCRPDGRCDYLSPQWVEYTGLPEQGQLGDGWTEQVHPEDRARTHHDWQEAAATGRDFVAEVRVRRADGAYHWFHARAVPLRDETGRIVKWFGTSTDIDDRMQAEEALKEAQDILRAAMDCSQAGIAIADAPNGKLRYVNRAGLLIRGASEAEAVAGVDIDTYVASWKLLDLDGTPLAIEEVPLAHAIAHGEEYSREFIIRRSDSEDRIVWANAAPVLDSAGQTKAAVVVFLDVTERRRTEESLQREQEFSRQLLETMVAGVVACDAEGKLTLFNHTARVWHGMDALEVPQEEWAGHYDLFLEDGQTPMTLENVPLARAYRGETVRDAGMVIRAKGQPPRQIVAGCTAMHDAQGRLLGAVGVMHDVTEQRRADEALQRAAELLSQSNEEVRQFAYIVSHDLRAPLVNIRGFASELSRALKELIPLVQPVLGHLGEADRASVDLVLRRDVPDALGFIDSSVIRMDHMTSSLLRLSRLGRHEAVLERLDLGPLVSQIVASLGKQIEAHDATVTVHPLPTVMGDRTSMEQILGNVLTNAILYLDPARPGRIEIAGKLAGTDLLMKVSDNGRGIAPDDRDKVFAPFRRAGASDVPGEGMGLAYVQTLIRRQGGHIWFESEPGVGTSFSFVLPVAQA